MANKTKLPVPVFDTALVILGGIRFAPSEAGTGFLKAQTMKARSNKTKTATTKTAPVAMTEREAIASVEWVHCVNFGSGRTVGIGYIDGKLCEVAIKRDCLSQETTTEAEPRTIAEAASFLIDLNRAEAMSGCDSQQTDKGWELFMAEVASAAKL